MVSSSLEHEDPAAAAEPPLFLHRAQRVAQIWDLVVWLHLPLGAQGLTLLLQTPATLLGSM